MKQGLINEVKQRFHEAQERIALRLLIWFEKEPSQDRVLTTPVKTEANGGAYVRYRSRAKRRSGEKEKMLRDRTGHAT